MAEGDPQQQFNDANNAQQQFTDRFSENVTFLRDAFTSLGFTIQDAIQEAIDKTEEVGSVGQRVAKSFERDIVNGIKKINGSLDSQIALQQKIISGQAKQADFDKEKIRIQGTIAAIQSRIQGLELLGVEINADLITQLEEQQALAQLQLEDLEKQNTERIKNLSLLEKGRDILKQHANSIDKSGMLSKVLSGNLKDVFSTANLLELAFVAIVKGAFDASAQMASFRKEIGISYSSSFQLTAELKAAAAASGDVFITSAKLVKSFNDLSKELGFIANFSGETLETFTNLTQRLGLGNKEAAQLTLLARSQSENTEDVLDNVSGTVDKLNAQKGTGILLKQVFTDIATASKSIVVSLGMNPSLIAEAATEARQLGLSLGEVDKIAGSLLNFEDSITKELKAELLLGQEINLEQARQAALMNDMVGLTQEIGKNQQVIDAFATGNRIQQQAIAESLGMSREEMANMVYQQQAQLLGAEAVREKFGEQAYEQLKARSAAEQFQDTLTKIQGIIGSFGMLLAPVLDAFAAIVGFLAESKLAVAGLVGYMGALATKSIVNAVASIFSSSFALGPFGLAIAGAGIAGLYAAVSSAKSQTANDMVQPGYGKRTILSPEGAIQLNDKDTIIAGTDLEGKKKTQAVTSPSTSVDIGPLVQEMAAVKNLLGQLLAKDTNVYMDSTKVGEALRVSAVKIN
jgi:uncharacterized membrane protein